MKRRLALVAFVVGCASCAHSAPQAQAIYQSLVDAGCLAPSPGGEQAVADANARPDRPAWLACLFNGGNVQSCAVPCQ